MRRGTKRTTTWLAGALALALGLGAPPAPAQERQRRNIFGMHNLKDGGPEFVEGMEWTRDLTGAGWVFDWVTDIDPWIEAAFQLNLVPCIRVQEGRGGALPDPGYAESVAARILNYKIAHPQYADRLVYLQLWNEPGDPRDFVPPAAYADYLVAATAGVRRAVSQAAAAHPNLGLQGTIKTMTPGQNGPAWWDAAFTHNPDAKFAFDVWATHPYPEAAPPHYNHHDGDVFIEATKTIDSYLLDLDVVARPHGNPPRSRRGFPVMITETAYGNKLGISYEGWPKTNRQLAAAYNVDAFGQRWYRWPEILAVHPFILANISWENFAWVPASGCNAPPSPGCSSLPRCSQECNGDGVREPKAPHLQYTAVRQLRQALEGQGMAPARLSPHRGAVGSIKGRIIRADTGAPVPYATVRGDGYAVGHVSLYDGGYEVHDVPVGSYTLTVEKNGYRTAARPVTVQSGQVTAADFSLVYTGKVSKGIYFIDSPPHSGCPGCNLFERSLGQTFTVPADVSFIKYAAAKPNIDGVTMKFSILEGGPGGPQVGSSITATLEPGDGANMIGGEWADGQEPPVQPGRTYFLKVERADGQGIYCYASNSNPYAGGNAWVGGSSLPGVDLLAVIRGLTTAVNTAVGGVAGAVRDTAGAPIGGARVSADPGGYSATTDAGGLYSLSGVAVGVYRVSAARAGYATETVNGVDVRENQTTTVNFALPPGAATGAIGGSVRDTSDRAIAGAEVTTTTAGPVLTDASGAYLLDGLAPGSYAVEARKTGFVPKTQPGVSVSAGQTTTLHFQLAPVVAAPPRIVNPDFEDDGGFFAVARGWTRFGGNKHEAVWDPGRVFTQGVADIPPSAVAGVYQTIAVTPGGRYRVGVHAKVTNTGYEATVGVDPAGGASPGAAQYGAGSRSASWAPLTVDFIATGGSATIFLRARNTQGTFLSGWVQFDAVTIQLLGSGNAPPRAVASASPASGPAPLAVQLDGRGSSDPDGDPLSYSWSFGDGAAPGSGALVSHTFTASGSYSVALTVDDGRGGSDSTTVAVTVGSAPTANRITNGDFAQGLTGWSSWTERGSLTPTVDGAGRLHLLSANHNGGVYQRFSTGGQGSRIEVSGFWASHPTVAQRQWAEVLVINGSRLPVNGQDVNAAQSDVVLVYKNDTWASPLGWSGSMATTSPVARVSSFLAAGTVATLVLKSGNVAGVTTGTRFDDIVVLSSAPAPTNQPPRATPTASPPSGAAPLLVQFDGSGSSDPDGDPLSYDWDFGDGTPHGSTPQVQHTFTSAGTFTVRLTVADGRGGSDTASVTIDVSGAPAPGPDVAVNGGFEQDFVAGVARGWARWSTTGTGYWKQSSRLGRIGSGSYGSGTAVFDAVTRLHPKVVLLEGNALGMAAAIRAALPDALIVGRLFIDPQVGQYLSNPEFYGARHAEDCVNQNRPEVDAWQGLNEPFLNDVANARLVARFEKAFSDRLQQLGRKSVVFNIAVGNPGDMNIMLLPEIVACLATADYVGYHAYGGINDQLMVGPESPWFAHRWRHYARMYQERGYRMPPVIYTECTTFYAWKQGHTPPGYSPFQPAQIRDDLIAFERESRQDPWSVGMAIFLLGSSSPQWEGWEVSNEPVIYQGAGDHNLGHPADAKAGLHSQQFGASAAFRGGLVQAVAVEPGATYRITTSMKYETYGPRKSVAYRIGYDPSGQTGDPDAPGVVWSDDLVGAESRETDIWYPSGHAFTATGTQASIWIAGAQDPGHDPFRVSVDEVRVERTTSPGPAPVPATQDPGTVWNEEPMEEFTGPVVRGWTRWHQGGGEFEWNRVAGESGWAQEVKKSNVQIGIHRQNRGFLAGDTYRLKLRARFTIGTGVPQVSVGVHPSGGTDPAGVAWGPPVPLATKGVWNDVVTDFVAASWAATVFLRVDFAGVHDGGVALDNLALERLTPRPAPAWMIDGSPPVEPPFIYGMHDPGAEDLFNQKGRKGWVVHAIAIGDDPADLSGRRFSEWVDGHGVIVRISHGFGDTLPHPSRFAQFALRCANFVKSSVGAGIWSIANEPGLERAGGVPITPEIYADAFIRCRQAIKTVRPRAQVITAGMVQGDVDFFERTMRLLEGQVDGIALHSYTNANYWNEAAFNLYREQMDRIPASMRGLPVYMTEAGNGATGPYPDQNNGFVDKLFRNVHEWNLMPGRQPIRSVNFYRWRSFDQWGIEGKPGMIADFLSALDGDYRWR